MKQPTPRQLSDWYMKQPQCENTCADCGKVGPSAYIQPQHPFYAGGQVGTALCADCIAQRNEDSRAKRKTELAAMPRCEVPACNRRATYRVGAVKLGLCGAHLKRTRTAHNRIMEGGGGMALFMPAPAYSREDLLRMAKAKA
jgi:hypothetical protein